MVLCSDTHDDSIHLIPQARLTTSLPYSTNSLYYEIPSLVMIVDWLIFDTLRVLINEGLLNYTLRPYRTFVDFILAISANAERNTTPKYFGSPFT